jgi:hypothetical protein
MGNSVDTYLAVIKITYSCSVTIPMSPWMESFPGSKVTVGWWLCNSDVAYYQPHSSHIYNYLSLASSVGVAVLGGDVTCVPWCHVRSNVRHSTFGYVLQRLETNRHPKNGAIQKKMRAQQHNHVSNNRLYAFVASAEHPRAGGLTRCVARGLQRARENPAGLGEIE